MSEPPMAHTPPVLAVVGPTAAGKSDLGVDLALRLDGEIINADSMQLYEGMDIGTAKLTRAERRGVPHHLLDVWPVTKTASVAEYQRAARAIIDELRAKGTTPILVGGSGLYVRAVLDDLDGFDVADRVLAGAGRYRTCRRNHFARCGHRNHPLHRCRAVTGVTFDPAW